MMGACGRPAAALAAPSVVFVAAFLMVSAGLTAALLNIYSAGVRGKTEALAIIDWCRENMAAYKYPRIVEFVESLPKSGAGKIMWRELQDREAAAAKQRATLP